MSNINLCQRCVHERVHINAYPCSQCKSQNNGDVDYFERVLPQESKDKEDNE